MNPQEFACYELMLKGKKKKYRALPEQQRSETCRKNNLARKSSTNSSRDRKRKERRDASRKAHPRERSPPPHDRALCIRNEPAQQMLRAVNRKTIEIRTQKLPNLWRGNTKYAPRVHFVISGQKPASTHSSLSAVIYGHFCSRDEGYFTP